MNTTKEKAPIGVEAQGKTLSADNTTQNQDSLICKITATKPSIVTKTFRMVQGQLVKETSANVVAGTLEKVKLQTMQDFAKILTGLGTDQCLTYGVPPHDARLMSSDAWEKAGRPADALPRTKERFSWSHDGGVMMLDYDAPKNGTKPLSKDALVQVVAEAIPSFSEIDALWFPSTSSCIYAGDAELQGIRGQRIYIRVNNARDIERAGRVLNDRLWAMGHGHYEVSKSGALLERGLFDTSVWQSNRIDFAAGAHCLDGLEQRRGDPVLINGANCPALDTLNEIQELSYSEIKAAKDNKKLAADAVKSEAEQQRAEWIEESVLDLVAAHGVSQDVARNIAQRAVEAGVLMGDWRINGKLSDGSLVTVSVLEALDNPAKYHGMVTKDPIEPDYDGSRWVGKLFLYSARPTLYSMAHGGRTYKLFRQPQRIELVSGKKHDATNAALDVLRRSTDAFDFGDELVTVGKGGKLSPLNDHALRHYLGGITQFWRWQKIPNKTELVERMEDPPIDICKTALALGGKRELKPLDAVITAPTLRRDGSVLSAPGYDADSRLLFDVTKVPPVVSLAPSNNEARFALRYLWGPFEHFPFVSSLDRAVHLAAILTTAVRATLPTCPAFAYDAPVQGSGKTLLARCVAALATGGDVGVWPHTHGNDEEVRKRIFTALREGSRAIIWDNVVGSFDSASMASALTSPVFTDRILGASNSSAVPNRAILILTGNNLSLRGELPRRVLVSRIDPATDKPFSRHFDFDPFERCLNNRQDMIIAALTLIRAQLEQTEIFGQLGKGRLASFEQWDAWVRQTVIYADQLLPGQFGDVMAIIEANQAADPEQESLLAYLEAWQRNFGNEFRTATQVLEVVKHYDNAFGGGDGLSAGEALREGLEALLPPRVPLHTLTPTRLGQYLKKHKDRVVGGVKLVSDYDKHRNSMVWGVRNV